MLFLKEMGFKRQTRKVPFTGRTVSKNTIQIQLCHIIYTVSKNLSYLCPFMLWPTTTTSHGFHANELLGF